MAAFKNNVFLQVSLATIFLMAILTAIAASIPVSSLESGPIEISQNIILLLAFVSWATLAVRLKSIPSRAIFAFFFALVVFVSLGRELSWLRVMGVSRDTSKIIEMTCAIVVLVLLFMLLIIWITKITNRKQLLIAFLKSNTFLYALTALFFLLVGDVFEKNLIEVSQPQILEEMGELTGHIFILISPTLELLSLRKEKNVA